MGVAMAIKPEGGGRVAGTKSLVERTYNSRVKWGVNFLSSSSGLVASVQAGRHYWPVVRHEGGGLLMGWLCVGFCELRIGLI